MYILKQVPEDFQVKEIASLDLDNGDYSYFLLKKKGRSTISTINEIAGKLKISHKRIGFAGNKDRNAITEQFISIHKIDKEKAEKLAIKDAELKFLGTSKKRLNLGDLEGNDFAITVRNLRKEADPITFIENYFDEQRFGINNCVIGKSIIKKEFKKACELLNLNIKNNDYVGALRKYGTRRLRFFLHSYQASLFNEFVAEYLRKNYREHYEINYSLGKFVFLKKIGKEIKIPLLGFLTELDDETKDIYKKIMDMEHITLKDFIIREIPELSLEGSERDLFVKIKNFKTRLLDDEINKGTFKQILMFELQKGSYATIVIKKMFFKENLIKELSS